MIDARVKQTSTTRSTLTRPNMSPRRPAIGVATQADSRNPLTNHAA
ncbi:hypothetical protein ABS642_10520 [Microbacterium sp. A8/3-1]|uniref:Uncharacterized protein n=1 Tax=Microbacterium sp. A8/3-1 TaxID=3160749 RepID=A0AAU7W1N5_9MICO